MVKYKICPSCKAKNDPTLLECIYCGEGDLTSVRVTDEEMEAMAEKPVNEPGANCEVEMVRVCECGEKNPVSARKCTVCGEDISDIMPSCFDSSVHEERKKTTVIALGSIDGKYVFRLTIGETVVGRECAMSEYLSAKKYVSRTQAKITVDGEAVYAENLSKTNFTYVNNKKITGRVKLESGDELGFGGICINGKRQDDAAYFIVRTDLCT